MRTALTVRDFLRRAEFVYGDRVGLIDEPEQPAASWGSATAYGRLAVRTRCAIGDVEAGMTDGAASGRHHAGATSIGPEPSTVSTA